MGGLLAELGKKLAERWLTLLVLPGALYVAAFVVAVTLGHAHSFDVPMLIDRAARTAAPAGLAVVLLLGFLLASAACGLAAQAVGAVVERGWLAVGATAWPRPLGPVAGALVRRRRRRWEAATADYRQAREQAAAARARAWLTGGPAEPAGLDGTYRRLSGISVEPPERPTWMGDRLNGVAVRLDRDLDLDLATVWPYLWLTVPETTRTEITAAREALARAATLAGWGLGYVVVGAFWWPALPVALAVVGTAHRRARAATDTYALLVEAAVRLHSVALAQQLGLPHEGPLDREAGWALTSLLHSEEAGR